MSLLLLGPLPNRDEPAGRHGAFDSHPRQDAAGDGVHIDAQNALQEVLETGIGIQVRHPGDKK